MERLLKATAIGLLLLVSGSHVAAGPFQVNGTGSNGWQNAGTINNNGTPFWDNFSRDGIGGWNIGHFLTGTGVFSSGPLGAASPGIANANLQFWGQPGFGPNKADPNFSLNNNGSTILAQLHLTASIRFSTNTIGWYSLSDPNTLHPLFTGTGYGVVSTYPLTVTFQPTGPFGLYIQTRNGTFYSDTSRNPALDRAVQLGIPPSLTHHQHFALFRDTAGDPNRFYIGVEDTFGSDLIESNGDFNDMVISLRLVPEPSSLALLGCASLVGIGRVLRRRKATVSV